MPVANFEEPKPSTTAPIRRAAERRSSLWFRLFFSWLLISAPTFAQELIPAGAEWKYWQAGPLADGWQDLSFADSEWASGKAQLGCGENDEATMMGLGENSHALPLVYFRHSFDGQTAEADDQLLLRWIADDGAVFYLNGEELYRTNMPAGELTSETKAKSSYYAPPENRWQQKWLPRTLLKDGANTLAVAVYQVNLESSDISFDLALSLDGPPAISRGPYLQMATAESMTVRWRTPMPSAAWVRYGTQPKQLNQRVGYDAGRKNHRVVLQGLQADTTYYYEVHNEHGNLMPSADPFFFTTAPAEGSADPFRVFVFGDSGTASRHAADVRDEVMKQHQDRAAAFWLMLGDNAYNNGTDDEYQRAVFDFYPTLLSHLPLWSTRGNHETRPKIYYNIFDLPTDGESGGLASGTEAYYSFDWANVHFICLDSQGSNRATDSPMVQWLQQDLAQTDQEWIVAFWHHPPYTKGTHDSDNPEDSGRRMTDMREFVLPTLEAGGVDLVLAGHTHSYERSYMIGGHYGLSTELQPHMILDGGSGDPAGDGPYLQHAGGSQGAVYVVAGSSGSGYKPKAHHPAMFRSLGDMGAVTMDFDPNQIHVTFVSRQGDTLDAFRLVREPDGASTKPAEVPHVPKSSSSKSSPK